MNKNVFGIILAGGKGTRMGNTDKPKQFLQIDGKPIIMHTIEKFALSAEFEAILVLVSKQWITFTKDIIKKSLPSSKNIFVIEGGDSRNGTLINAIDYLKQNYEVNEDTIVVTHDSVRPFVSHRIIKENIKAASQYGCCDTVIAASDTIVVSENHQTISNIPERHTMYQGQTPQSFKINAFLAVYEQLTEEEKSILTDACKIFTLKGKDVYLVDGDVTNFKITYPFDVKMAESLLKM